jgi:hypothetical protein
MATPVKKRRKKAQSLTTDQVLNRVFPKPLVRSLKKLIAQLNSDVKPPRKQPKSKSRSKL